MGLISRVSSRTYRSTGKQILKMANYFSNDKISAAKNKKDFPDDCSLIAKNILPINVSGLVVRGFGRGSSDLGIKTANFPTEVVDSLPTDLDAGIYYCWAQVHFLNSTCNKSPIVPAVMSIGWNPFYNNEKKSMETHLIHEFDKDWYNETLKVVIVGRLRGEANFKSLQDLIDAINKDIQDAKIAVQTDYAEACKNVF